MSKQTTKNETNPLILFCLLKADYLNTVSEFECYDYLIINKREFLIDYDQLSSLDKLEVKKRTIAISHPWFTKNHPDIFMDNGETKTSIQFETIKNFVMDNGYKYLFYDYCCITQIEESDFQKKQLQNISIIFQTFKIYSLNITEDYNNRLWCLYELMCNISKVRFNKDEYKSRSYSVITEKQQTLFTNTHINPVKYLFKDLSDFIINLTRSNFTCETKFNYLLDEIMNAYKRVREIFYESNYSKEDVIECLRFDYVDFYQGRKVKIVREQDNNFKAEIIKMSVLWRNL